MAPEAATPLPNADTPRADNCHYRVTYTVDVVAPSDYKARIAGLEQIQADMEVVDPDGVDVVTPEDDRLGEVACANPLGTCPVCARAPTEPDPFPGLMD